MKFRTLRVSSLIKEKLGALVFKELEFGGALVTLTEIEVSKDQENAVVNFSVFPSEKADRVLYVLNKFKPRLQFLLQRALEIKPMPQLFFRIDEGPENAAKVEKALLKNNIDKEV